MKKIAYNFTVILTLLSVAAFAQSNDSLPRIAPKTDGVIAPPQVANNSTDTSIVHKVVDVIPEFPGGMPGLRSFLVRNLNYPTDALTSEITGRVHIQFTVCEDGTLCNEKIVKSLGYGCDEEVIRVLKAMPKWKPGEIGGKKVKTMFTLPVTFMLLDEETEKSK